MKKIILIALIAFVSNVKAQFTLEHTYDNAATYNNCSGNLNQLMIINFEVSGERYVKINRCGGLISIYNMNHSLVKDISIVALPHEPYDNIGSILYLSEHLFNLDSKIEFLYVSRLGSFYTTNIYNEDGDLLFTENGSPIILTNIQLQQYPIYNTSVGTKMILSYQNGQAKVFGVAGTLSTVTQIVNNDSLVQKNLISNPYPNPAIESTTIDYKLPDDINQAEIVFYDLQGKELKRFKVDKTFNSLLISTDQLAGGTYYYQLQTNKGTSGGKKLVVVK